MLKRSREASDDSAVLTKTQASGITLAIGVFTVALDAGDTDDLEGTFYGTLRLYLATGSVQDVFDTTYPNDPFIVLNIIKGSVKAVS